MQACFAIFSSLLHGSELSQKKSLLTRLCCQKGRCIFIHRGSTHFVFSNHFIWR